MDPEDNGVIPEDSGQDSAPENTASPENTTPAEPNISQAGQILGNPAGAEGAPPQAQAQAQPVVTATIQDKNGKSHTIDLTAEQFHGVLRGPDAGFDGMMEGDGQQFIQAAQSPGKPLEPVPQQPQGQPAAQPVIQPQRSMNPMGNAGQFMGPGYKYDDQGNAIVPKGIPLRTLSVPRGSKFLGYRPDGSAVIGPGWNAFPKVQEGDPSKTPQWQAQHRAAIAAEPSTVGGTASGDLKPDQLAPDGKTVISGRDGSTRPYNAQATDTRTAKDFNVVAGGQNRNYDENGNVVQPYNPQQRADIEKAKIHAQAIENIGRNRTDTSTGNNTRTNQVRALSDALNTAKGLSASKLANQANYAGSEEEAADLKHIKDLENQLLNIQKQGAGQQQSAAPQPARKFYQGKYWVKGPDGKAHLDPNQNP